MSKILLKHILEKHFGKDHVHIKYAQAEILNLFSDRDSDNLEDKSPAYLDSSDKNLKEGFYCYFCNMPFYNCLCSHDD